MNYQLTQASTLTSCITRLHPCLYCTLGYAMAPNHFAQFFSKSLNIKLDGYWRLLQRSVIARLLSAMVIQYSVDFVLSARLFAKLS